MINHKANCTHAQTPAARKACRKADKVAKVTGPTYTVGTVGKGKAVHMIEAHGAFTRCGKENFVTTGTAPVTDITCKSCAAKIGHAHG